VFPKEGYLGIDYTDGIIFIQVTWNAGRSTEVKKAFYGNIADDLHSKAGVRKQDLFRELVFRQRRDAIRTEALAAASANTPAKPWLE
jgi:Tautomerase enzyme